MKTWLLLPLALPLIAAAPAPRQFSLAVPSDSGGMFGGAQPQALGAPVRNGYEPAPLPNRDVSGLAAPRSSNAPTLSPTLFTNKTQYRGDGFSANSTAQSEQEKNLKPGFGFNLHMPLSSQ